MSACNLCQAGHASACPLANRESEQTAPRDALLFGSWRKVPCEQQLDMGESVLLALRLNVGRSGLKTVSDGEFGWGGTSIK